MMAGFDPLALPGTVCSSDSDDFYGELPDFSHELQFIIDAVTSGEIRSKRAPSESVSSYTELPMSEIVSWLRSTPQHHGLADRLDPEMRWQSRSAVNRQSASTNLPTSPTSPMSGKKFSKSKIVAELGFQWPTIQTDLSNASRNGLADVARTDARGWDPDRALDWATRNGKTINKKGGKPAPHSVFAINPVGDSREFS